MNNYKSSKYNIFLQNRDARGIILYNTVSGGIALIKPSTFGIMSKESFLLDEIEDGDALLENGYIVNAELDEYQRIKHILENSIKKKNQNILTYVIAPTLNCNFNCSYCFQKDFRTSGDANIIKKETSDAIINFVLEQVKVNPQVKEVRVTWFGGEPLLAYKEILYLGSELYETLKKQGIRFSSKMITNGAFLTDDRLHIMYDICRLSAVQITIDGDVSTYCEKKRTKPEMYQKVLDNIENATKLIPTTVRLNADKKNFKELIKVARALCESVGESKNFHIHFAQIRDYENCGENSDCFDDLEFRIYRKKFYDELKEFGMEEKQEELPCFSPRLFCGIAPGNNYVIDYLGNLYKCEHYIGDKNKTVGSVWDGLYYNEAFCQAQALPVDTRCEKCQVFPCCNYAQCEAMHNFSGTGKKCACYEKQFERITLAVETFINDKI